MSSSDTGNRGFAVPRALLGFVILLCAVTAVSYAVGRMVGPVAPGLHRTEESPAGDGVPGMSDMHGMETAPGLAGEGK